MNEQTKIIIQLIFMAIFHAIIILSTYSNLKKDYSLSDKFQTILIIIVFFVLLFASGYYNILFDFVIGVEK